MYGIRMMHRSVSAAILLALALPTLAADGETADRLAAMQLQLDGLTAHVTRMEEKSPDSALLSLQSQIDALKTELQDIKGQLDEQAHDLAVAQKREADLYQDLDTRLKALSQPTADSAGNSSVAASNGAPASATSDTTLRQTSEQAKAYQAALSLFKQGDYSGAIVAFKKFIKAWPDDPQAASAQYWIGNAFFSTRDFQHAASEQQKLIKTYPKSPKVPDALLNLSSAQVELGDMDAARKTLKLLLKKFPDSQAAMQGKKRLQLLQGA